MALTKIGMALFMLIYWVPLILVQGLLVIPTGMNAAIDAYELGHFYRFVAISIMINVTSVLIFGTACGHFYVNFFRKATNRASVDIRNLKEK